MLRALDGCEPVRAPLRRGESRRGAVVIRPPRRAPYDLGALDDAYASAIGCACDVGDVTDLLPGSASKGATIGAAAGSIIPGVGTVVGGAVGAAAGAISDFLGGGKHCTSNGKDVPCPNCGF